MINYLALSWSVSRGRETYGYNICRLDDRQTGERYKCMGGGYDMVGTVIGQWLADVYQTELIVLMTSSPDLVSVGYGGYTFGRWKKIPDLYGAIYDSEKRRVSLDGACGKECMIQIAEKIGIVIRTDYDRRKDCTVGFFVEQVTK